MRAAGPRPPSRESHRLAGLMALALAGPAAAQAAQPPVGDSPLVVTATRTATPIDRVGSSISLITAADIAAHQWRTLPDALADASGLNIVQTGGPGGYASVFIRGANANHTKVLIDGIEANDPSQNGAFDFGQALTAGIASVEVLRGPQSSLYGSDAIGGVINILTASGDGPAKFDGSLEGGAFDTFNQTARVNGSVKGFHYAITLGHLSAGATPMTPLDLLPPGRVRIDDAYENATVSLKLGADLAANASLGLTARYVDYALRFTGDDFSVYPSVPAAAQTDQDGRQVFIRGEGRLSLLDGAFSNVVGIGYSRFRTRLQSPDVPFEPQAPTFDRGDRLKFDWQGTVALARSESLVLGAEEATDRLIQSPVSAAISDGAVFAELQSAIGGDFNIATSARLDDNDRFGTAATWRLAPVWRIAATGTVVRATYGTGFKAPTLSQLFVSFPAFGFFSNPNLRPERSRGYDIGFEQPLAGGHLVFGATWFNNAITDLIDTNAAGDSLANIGRATTYGLESFLKVTPIRRLTLRADYTYTVAKDDATGLELLRRPRNKASLAAAWQAGDRLSISGTLIYVGSWVDGNRSFSIPRLDAPAYAVANIAAAYDLTPSIQLFGRIDNLLGRRYEDPVGFQRPGFGALGGVRLKLGG
ncbi:MAG TPA: TonB-dependent receptor [Caulobacteraceae bacterium]